MKFMKPLEQSSDTVAQVRPAAEQLAATMRGLDPRRIYLIGNGTSLYLSLAASYTARLLAAPGDPIVLALPAGDFRYFPPASRGTILL